MSARKALVPTIAAIVLALAALAAPAAAAAAEWVQPPLTLETAPDLSAGDAVIDETGRGTVAWTAEQAGTDVALIRRLDAAGVPGPVVALSDPAGGDVRDLAMGASAAGEVVAVWVQGPSGSRVVRSRRIGAGGSLGPIVDLTAVANVSNPRVEVDAAGFAYLTWMRLIDGSFAIEGRAAFAGGAFGPTRIFSSGGSGSTGPELAIGPAGTTLVTWRRSNPESQVQGKLVSGDGAPGALLEIAGGEDQATGQDVAARPDGSFVVVFRFGLGDPLFEDIAQARIVGPGGALSALIDLSELGDSVGNAKVAVAADGTATAVWRYRANNIEPSVLEARRLLADGSLGAHYPAVSTGEGNIERVELGVDAAGNATVAWDNEDPLFEIVTRRIPVAGPLEPAAQQVLAAPSAANPREASRPALDVAGDGRALLAFGRTGSGEQSDQIQALRFVSPAVPDGGGGGGAGPGGGGGGAIGPLADTAPPLISRLRLTPRAFRVAGRRAAKKSASASRRRARAGTRIRLRVSEPLRATFLVQRKLPGRRAGGRCVKPRQAPRKAKRCTRFKRVGKSFSRRIGAGGNAALKFSGRIGKRKLGPGRYRLSARGVDGAGNRTAKPRRAGFRVVR